MACVTGGATPAAMAEGVTAATPATFNEPASSPVRTAIEYVHAGYAQFFVTASDAEVAALDSGEIAGWSRTGYTFSVYAADTAGTMNVCRFISTHLAPESAHVYTAVAHECDLLKRNGVWQFEADVFAVSAADVHTGTCSWGTTPLYRLYDATHARAAPSFRHTVSAMLREQLAAEGWTAWGFGRHGVMGCVPH
jgi:hypothetical protein